MYRFYNLIMSQFVDKKEQELEAKWDVWEFDTIIRGKKEKKEPDPSDKSQMNIKRVYFFPKSLEGLNREQETIITNVWLLQDSTLLPANGTDGIQWSQVYENYCKEMEAIQALKMKWIFF